MSALTPLLIGAIVILGIAIGLVSFLPRRKSSSGSAVSVPVSGVNVSFVPPAAAPVVMEGDARLTAHMQSINQKFVQFAARLEEVEGKIFALEKKMGEEENSPPAADWFETVPVRKKKIKA